MTLGPPSTQSHQILIPFAIPTCFNSTTQVYVPTSASMVPDPSQTGIHELMKRHISDTKPPNRDSQREKDNNPKMRIGEVVAAVSLLSTVTVTATATTILEPCDNTFLQNIQEAAVPVHAAAHAPQASCDFGSVLEYFENLPPIPRSCLAPLAKYATTHCSSFLGIEEHHATAASYTATALPMPEASTELALAWETTQATATIYE